MPDRLFTAAAPRSFGQALVRTHALASIAPLAPVAAAFVLSLASPPSALAQAPAPVYGLPPDPIPRILDAPPTPLPSLSPDRRSLLLMEREGMPPVSRLAEPELRLAGIRLNPATNGPSRTLFGVGLRLVDTADGSGRELTLPQDLRIGHPAWSPDSARFAFTHTGGDGVELWILERESGESRRLLGPELNAVLGDPFVWNANGRSLYVRRVPPGRGAPPAAPAVPPGPVIQESLGATEPVRTYQDLLANAHDEALFEHYASSEWVRVSVEDGAVEPVLPVGIWSGLEVSPDGRYLLATRYKPPYSYLAPIFAFPREIDVYDREGRLAHRLEDRLDTTPPRIGRDMVHPGPRDPHWRADAPATLAWAEAVDGGDARAEAGERDRVLLFAAPFEGEPETLLVLDQRYAGVTWGRGDAALVHSAWRTTSRTKTYRVRPDEAGAAEAEILFDRSLEDRYAHPGTPLTEPRGSGHRVLFFDGEEGDGEGIFLSGEGASPEGNYPFLDRLDLASGESERLWRCEDPWYESALVLLSRDGRRLLTRRESPEEPPNFYLRDLEGGEPLALTDFPDPAPELAGLRRELIVYERSDGVPLSAALLTPPGYEPERDGPLPLLLWAYPREFRDAAAAGQVADSPNRFSRPSGASHLFLLTQGYAILDGPAMPIIGEGEVEPNDTYIEQLVASAEAAVEKAVALGVAEHRRVAVGGHSYGAFMATNLLAHSELFRAGIARSGAFNRTLTPFGFQAEPRSFWEASETYLRMSPFAHADRIRAPVLFIHGAEDDNAGTFPMQSERMYHAVAGNGGDARLVMLPHESHGYVARESVLHALAEMVAWMERYVKGDEEP